jgi:hypothetical protein
VRVSVRADAAPVQQLAHAAPVVVDDGERHAVGLLEPEADLGAVVEAVAGGAEAAREQHAADDRRLVLAALLDHERRQRRTDQHEHQQLGGAGHPVPWRQRSSR